MMGVINPVVNRENGRRRWARSVFTYGLGLTMTSVLVGGMIGGLGRWLSGGSLWGGLLPVLAFTAIGYGLHELRLLRLPYPQRRAQVPNVWRRRYHQTKVSFFYGLGLGANFFTHIPTSAFYVLTIAVLMLASPFWGAMAFVSIALGRWLILLPVGMRIDGDWPDHLARRFLRLDNTVRVLNGVVLVALGTWLVVGWGLR